MPFLSANIEKKDKEHIEKHLGWVTIEGEPEELDGTWDVEIEVRDMAVVLACNAEIANKYRREEKAPLPGFILWDTVLNIEVKYPEGDVMMDMEGKLFMQECDGEAHTWYEELTKTKGYENVIAIRKELK